MYTMDEDTVMMIVKQRMDDAMRYAEQRRALRLARAPRPSTRVRLGMAVIRLTRWLMGDSSMPAGTMTRLESANSGSQSNRDSPAPGLHLAQK
jgi:hypothetical protein